MKKIGIYFLLATFLTVPNLASADSGNKEEEVKCDSKSLKKAGISELNPYYYSSSKVNIIQYDYKQTRKEIEVPLFKGEKYRMVFNKSALPKDIVIKIYDKDSESSNRKPIFSSEGQEGDLIIFEPKKSKNLYVNYFIPPAEGNKEGGCIAFILGYQLTFITEKEEEESVEEETTDSESEE